MGSCVSHEYLVYSESADEFVKLQLFPLEPKSVSTN